MAFTTNPQGSACLATAATLSRCQASKHDLIHLPPLSKHNLGASSAALTVRRGTRRNMNIVVLNGAQPGGPLPSDPSCGLRKICILGTIMTVLLSFTKGKWGPLLKLKEELEERMDAIEDVMDMVEDAAEKVDKVAEGISDNLPDGKLRDFADFVENLAEQVDKGAELAGDALEKVEQAEELIETFLQ
ncbi:hypothetical protein L6164_030627 [Bauhinia variegata]|uniref:Uncharacterized protein n=1 Tax=Bauhinia variegata TaxID=167791 RepID=A0ACB9LE98_BAUVA|nr:hypothetical protein L6164_030627 [Bauhinia variegata]